MKTGLLWYDDNPGRSLAEKLRPAARRHVRKYGYHATHCFVHKDFVFPDSKTTLQVDGITVKRGRSVLKHHLWLGRPEIPSRKGTRGQTPAT